MFVTNVMDATRISDGKLVSLKRVKSSSQEIVIASLLSSEGLRKDPRNHCVPILDIIPIPNSDDEVIVVMLFLREATQPIFERVGEVVDYLHQLLEVLP